jgi:hypothetical protein
MYEVGLVEEAEVFGKISVYQEVHEKLRRLAQRNLL